MKKFAGHKPIDVIRQQCKDQGVPLNTHLHDNAGWDTIVVGHRYGRPLRNGHAVYNTFSGRFYGVTDKGVEFNSDSAKHDKEPWMQALLSFFYVEKGAAPKAATTAGCAQGAVL